MKVPKDNPAVPLDKLQIQIDCSEPPTMAMQQITEVQTKGENTVRIPVIFEVVSA